MPRERTQMGILGDLQSLSAAMDANKEELPQMEPFRLRLTGIVTQALEVSRQQVALKASQQELSGELRWLLTEGQRLATVVRRAVKEHYGVGEEKVTEFGVQPFRGPKAKPSPQEPALRPAPPAVSEENATSDR
jgi:hypothetical protein